MRTPEKIIPERVIQILKENGQEISVEQAESVIEFIMMLANIAVEQVLTDYSNYREINSLSK